MLICFHDSLSFKGRKPPKPKHWQTGHDSFGCIRCSFPGKYIIWRGSGHETSWCDVSRTLLPAVGCGPTRTLTGDLTM